MENYQEIFIHHYWIQNSDRLYYSAEALLEKLRAIQDYDPPIDKLMEHESNKRSLLEISFMLIGYSIENILKGYSIFKYLQTNKIPKNPDYSFMLNSVWKTKNGNDLDALGKNAGIIFSKEEMEILNKFQKYVTWGGRYHIPNRLEDIKLAILPGISETFRVNDRTIAKSLMKRLKDEMS